MILRWICLLLIATASYGQSGGILYLHPTTKTTTRSTAKTDASGNISDVLSLIATRTRVSESVQISESSGVPSTVAGYSQLYIQPGSLELSVKKGDGTTASIEGGGGGGTLQDAYDASPQPATIAMADNETLKIQTADAGGGPDEGVLVRRSTGKGFRLKQSSSVTTFDLSDDEGLEFRLNDTGGGAEQFLIQHSGIQSLLISKNQFQAAAYLELSLYYNRADTTGRLRAVNGAATERESFVFDYNGDFRLRDSSSADYNVLTYSSGFLNLAPSQYLNLSFDSANVGAYLSATNQGTGQQAFRFNANGAFFLEDSSGLVSSSNVIAYGGPGGELTFAPDNNIENDFNVANAGGEYLVQDNGAGQYVIRYNQSLGGTLELGYNTAGGAGSFQLWDRFNNKKRVEVSESAGEGSETHYVDPADQGGSYEMIYGSAEDTFFNFDGALSMSSLYDTGIRFNGSNTGNYFTINDGGFTDIFEYSSALDDLTLRFNVHANGGNFRIRNYDNGDAILLQISAEGAAQFNGWLGVNSSPQTTSLASGDTTFNATQSHVAIDSFTVTGNTLSTITCTGCLPGSTLTIIKTDGDPLTLTDTASPAANEMALTASCVLTTVNSTAQLLRTSGGYWAQLACNPN